MVPSTHVQGSVPPCPLGRFPMLLPLATRRSSEANGPKKEGLGCYNQSARPLCLHGLIPLDLRRVELFKQMAKIIRVAGVSARSAPFQACCPI